MVCEFNVNVNDLHLHVWTFYTYTYMPQNIYMGLYKCIWHIRSDFYVEGKALLLMPPPL